MKKKVIFLVAGPGKKSEKNVLAFKILLQNYKYYYKDYGWNAKIVLSITSKFILFNYRFR